MQILYIYVLKSIVPRVGFVGQFLEWSCEEFEFLATVTEERQFTRTGEQTEKRRFLVPFHHGCK